MLKFENSRNDILRIRNEAVDMNGAAIYKLQLNLLKPTLGDIWVAYLIRWLLNMFCTKQKRALLTLQRLLT